MKLSVELVPKTCWFSNVRALVSREVWDRLRKETYRKAGYVCEVCGAKGRLECHEVWEYDDKNKLQILRDLVALCPSCHEVKHFGLATARGRDKTARRHLAKINGWTDQEVDDYLAEVWQVWHERSAHDWKLVVARKF